MNCSIGEFEMLYWGCSIAPLGILKDVESDLMRCVDAAIGAGIDRDKIILDPGIGFGKTYEQNLQLMNDLQIMNNVLDVTERFDSEWAQKHEKLFEQLIKKYENAIKQGAY